MITVVPLLYLYVSFGSFKATADVTEEDVNEDDVLGEVCDNWMFSSFKNYFFHS